MIQKAKIDIILYRFSYINIEWRMHHIRIIQFLIN